MAWKALLSIIGYIFSALGFAYAFSSMSSRAELNEMKFTSEGGLRLFAAAGLWYWSTLAKAIPEHRIPVWFRLSFTAAGLIGLILTFSVWFL
ncbi:hypothetical protein [Metabacillus sp. 84]|uniref:hypothetical protein n=1 Tax=unclassified Metabacillus TaxID=2675274 RepID=UPI003CE6884E